MQAGLDQRATGIHRAGNAFANGPMGLESDNCGVGIVPVARFYGCLKFFEFRGVHVFFPSRGRVARPAMGLAMTNPELERKLGICFSDVKLGRGIRRDGNQ
jgi:hypothetical protein